jgi:hypothetical protein
VHREEALLYNSGELNIEETSKFDAHLPDCSDCLERVSLARASKRAAQASVEDAPPELLQASIDRLSDPGTGESGMMSAGLKTLLLSVAAIGAYWAYEKTGQAPVESAPAVAASRTAPARLSMPDLKGKPVSNPGPRIRGRSPRGSRGGRLSSALPMPPRPLDCSDRSSILAFKRYAWWEFYAGEAHGVYTADRWATCVCGNAAQAAGRPAAPPKRSGARMQNACPTFVVGPVSQARHDSFMEVFLPAAKHYHKYLPLSREQAIKMTECVCGAIPEVVD